MPAQRFLSNALPFFVALGLTGCSVALPGQAQTDSSGQARTATPVQAQTDSSGQARTATPGQAQTEIYPVSLNRSYRDSTKLRLNKQVLNTASLEFFAHSGKGPFESYLAQNIPFEPIEKLRSQIEREYAINLKHRGEAHITVVTPPEFERLSSSISIEEINQLAENIIQLSSVEIVCLGSGQSVDKNKTSTTFFVVVRSKDLTTLRNAISRAFANAGGTPPAFQSQFHPHITVGFTARDLYESDGVIKNSSSCIRAIELD